MSWAWEKDGHRERKYGLLARLFTETLSKGRYESVGPDKIRVYELPVGFWTESFKEYLEELIEPGLNKEGKKIVPLVKDYADMSKDTTVDFIIILQKGKLDELEATQLEHGCNGIEKLFKLTTTSSTTNMHLFDADDKLKKYDTVEEIIDDYFETRMQLYVERKAHLIDALEKVLIVLSNKARYIQELLDDTIDLRKRKRSEIVEMLLGKSYDIIDEDGEFKYLVKMSMDSVSEENVDKLNRDHKDKLDELQRVKETTERQMWLVELENLEKEYSRYRAERLCLGDDKKKSGSKIIAKAGSVKKIVKKSKGGNLDLIEE